ncbi:MAG: EI24 domain-containing protein, partial [Deltaproteobacteria bacterium]|nr:EI24 domain-containing protein [Deltaproteobacteria bacterium]
LKCPWTGWSMLSKHPSLKVRLIIPYSIIALVFALLVYLFTAEGVSLIHSFVHQILATIHLDPDQMTQMNMLQKILFYPLLYLLKVLFYLISAALVMLLTLMVGNILCAFFWELLIEEVFKIEGKAQWVFQHESLLHRIVTPLAREVVKELMYLLFFIAAWLCTIIPVIGPMISLVLGPVVICFWFGFIVSDFSMSVMAAKVKQRLIYGRSKWLYLTGMGLYALVPILGLVIYPLFIIGHAKNIVTHDKLIPSPDVYV